ncbi:MAG: SEC-C metal-binding domain-containing protein [Thermodesulfobacteriota bacterium]
MKKKKIGRNEHCPCGSGLKYKKCHGHQAQDQLYNKKLPVNTQRQIIEQIIKDQRHKADYGETRPIIATDFKGYKFVAVGNQLHYSKTWKTFHDFLFDYIKNCLGPDWGNLELKKDVTERHPIIGWYKCLCDFQRKHIKEDGEIYSAVCTGPVGAYISLAYDLYVLRHHALLQSRLVERLKDKQQFQGARYETYVTASFIKAGFEIDFEDEADKSKSHCEFVAAHKASGKKYSVEAKSRHRSGILGRNGTARNFDEIRLRIGGLLRTALKKEALHTRVVFIDLNMPPEEGGPFDQRWFKSLLDEIDRVEKEGLTGEKAPSAYLFFTNHPYHYVGNEEPEPQKNFLMTAINMPVFKISSPEIAMQADPPIFKLWESINSHIKVPNKFDE